MLKEPGPGGSGEVLLPHGTKWNALKGDAKTSPRNQNRRDKIPSYGNVYFL